MIGIDTPDSAWSFLGVTVAKVDPNPPEKFTIQTYGYDGPVPAMSQGRAHVGNCLGIIHFASTEAGWSGSPLMRNGKIVGIHRGFQPGGQANYGVGIAPLVAGFESKDRSKGYTRVDKIGDNYEEYGLILKGQKHRIRAARGMYSSHPSSDWVPASGRKWSDMVDDDDNELPSFPTFESKREGVAPVKEQESSTHSFPSYHPVSAEMSATAKAFMAGCAPDIYSYAPARKGSGRTVPQATDLNFRSKTTPEAAEVKVVPAAVAIAGGSSSEERGDNEGNGSAPRQSGGVTQNSRTSASTTGTKKLRDGQRDGTSAAQRAASSIPPAVQKNTESGHSSRDSPGHLGDQQQKSKASDSKPTVEAPKRRRKKVGKEPALEQNTLTSSKTLQARVDSIRSELFKQEISSESGAKAYTLLRDLLSYAMRCESRQA